MAKAEVLFPTGPKQRRLRVVSIHIQVGRTQRVQTPERRLVRNDEKRISSDRCRLFQEAGRGACAGGHDPPDSFEHRADRTAQGLRGPQNVALDDYSASNSPTARPRGNAGTAAG